MKQAYLVFIDKNYHWMPRRAQFRHVVLLEPDKKHPSRWALRQWRNGRELTVLLDEGDFTIDGDQMVMEQVIETGRLDADMNGENDNDVTWIKVDMPQVARLRPVKMFRATDVGFVKYRLGISDIRIQTPYQLYRYFKQPRHEKKKERWWAKVRP